MTLEEMTRFSELRIQLRKEREKNNQLLKELDQITQGEVWIETQNQPLPHIRIDLCVSLRAIMQCRNSGETSNLAYSVFGQAKKLIERAIARRS